MEIVERLEAAKRLTLSYYHLSADDLVRTYGAGKWSIRFILHHLADTETVLYDRIRRIISEPRQVIWALDQDAWAAGLDYSSVPMDMSRRLFEAARDGVIHQARNHYLLNGAREFVHSETGVRTLKDEFDKVAAHNEKHLTQIERALESR